MSEDGFTLKETGWYWDVLDDGSNIRFKYEPCCKLIENVYEFEDGYKCRNCDTFLPINISIKKEK